MDFKAAFQLMFIIALVVITLWASLWLIQISLYLVVLLFPIAFMFVLAVLVTMAVLAVIRTVRK